MIFLVGGFLLREATLSLNLLEVMFMHHSLCNGCAHENARVALNWDPDLSYVLIYPLQNFVQFFVVHDLVNLGEVIKMRPIKKLEVLFMNGVYTTCFICSSHNLEGCVVLVNLGDILLASYNLLHFTLDKFDQISKCLVGK